jgi:hypothetical protein
MRRVSLHYWGPKAASQFRELAIEPLPIAERDPEDLLID